MLIDLRQLKFDDSFIDEKEIDNIDCNIFGQDGTLFINGACDIFAYALKLKYNDYDIYEAISNSTKACHYYCVKNGKYIDVQGTFDSLDELLKNIPRFDLRDYKSKKIDDYMPDLTTECALTILNFAKEIIKSYDYIYYVI